MMWRNSSANGAPPPPPSMKPHNTFTVPEGWEMVIDTKRDGTRVKYYTNILGQKFYNEEDLMRNIRNAKANRLGIYDPEFDPSTIGKKRPRKGVASSSKCKKEKLGSSAKGKCKKKNSNANVTTSKKQGVEAQHDEQPKRTTLSQLSDPTEGADGCRTSRRLAGLGPELRHDFVFNKALEYVIKDKPN